MSLGKFHITVLLALQLASQLCSAQGVGEVKFVINPGHEYQVKVDGDSIWSDRILELPEGEHQIEVWSPGYLPFDTVINVEAGKSTEVYKVLTKREDYKVFLNVRKQSISSHNRKVSVSFVVNMVGVAYTGYQFFQMRKHYNELPEIRNLYENSSRTAVVDNSRVEFYEKREEFIKDRKSFRLGAALTLVSTGITYYLINKRRKDILPVYEDKYRPKFESLGLGLIPPLDNDRITPSIALTFKL